MFKEIDTMALFKAVKTANYGDVIKLSDYEIKKGETENRETSENK